MARGNEATDSISFYLRNLPSTAGRQREPTEQDPQILNHSPDADYIATLQHGETKEFKLTYSVFKGPVKITWRFVDKWGNCQGYFKGKSYKRNFQFAFTIAEAKTEHNGRYMVEILDKHRHKRDGRNPVTIEWQVKVNPPK